MGTDTISKAEKCAKFKVAFITGATIFIMGYANALALHTAQLGLMITPQTGNVIWMGLNPVLGEWGAWASNLLLFFGFVFGCGFAVMPRKLIKSTTGLFFFKWLLFALPVALLPFYMRIIDNSQFLFLMMGLSAGFGVGFFRIMYHLDQINNAMATGSVRFVGVYFAEAFLKGNKKETFTFILFVICVALFALGATAFGIATHIDYALGIIPEITRDVDRAAAPLFSAVNMALLAFCIIPMFCAPKDAK